MNTLFALLKFISVLSMRLPYAGVSDTAILSHYTVIDLGTLSEEHWFPKRINANGDMIGNFSFGPGSDGVERAYYIRDEGSTDIGRLGDVGARAEALNNRGQVVGNSRAPEGMHAFVWQRGTMQDLDASLKTRSFAHGINDRGQIVGAAVLPGRTVACLWNRGKRLLLGTLGGSVSDAMAINNRGAIVGAARIHPGRIGEDEHAFLYRNGQMRDLGTLPGISNSEATRINEAGQVIGSASNGSYVPNAIPPRGVLWDHGKIIELTPWPNFDASSAEDINDRGQVVGYMTAFSKEPVNATDQPLHDRFRAFLYQNGHMIDLNTLIPADSGWTLETAVGINNRGQIVGSGRVNGKPHAFLLTPVSR